MEMLDVCDYSWCFPKNIRGGVLKKIFRHVKFNKSLTEQKMICKLVSPQNKNRFRVTPGLPLG